MHFTFQEIKTALEEHWTEIEDSAYVDDWLSEFADGIVPVYYNDIINDWKEMDAHFMESGRDMVSEDATITSRMTADLWNYYQDQVRTAYEQLKGEE